MDHCTMSGPSTTEQHSLMNMNLSVPQMMYESSGTHMHNQIKIEHSVLIFFCACAFGWGGVGCVCVCLCVCVCVCVCACACVCVSCRYELNYVYF